MTKHDCDRNVFLYRLHVLFNEPIFWGPILITSLQKLGHMSLPDIYYCESIVLMICLTLDIPSGALADVIGRARSDRDLRVDKCLNGWAATARTRADRGRGGVRITGQAQAAHR